MGRLGTHLMAASFSVLLSIRQTPEVLSHLRVSLASSSWIAFNVAFSWFEYIKTVPSSPPTASRNALTNSPFGLFLHLPVELLAWDGSIGLHAVMQLERDVVIGRVTFKER